MGRKGAKNFSGPTRNRGLCMHGGKPSPGGGAKRRLLIVAQDIEIRGRLAKLLLGAGHAIELAESGQRAREVAQSERIDLCVILCEEVSRITLELADELDTTIGQVVIASAA